MKTILASVVAMVAAATVAGRHAGAAACSPNLANDVAIDASATQLITVVAPKRSSVQATLRLWRKDGDCWLAVSPAMRAWVGLNGLAATRREGDGTTPIGIFELGDTIYGVGPNPGGLRYRYRRIVCGDWWVEDPRSPFYNRLYHARCGAKPPFRVTSPDLSRSPRAYRHFAFVRYNADPVVPGAGSGIFLHASIAKPTHGCISLALEQLVTVLRWLRPASAPRIAIGTAASLRARS